MKSQEKGIPKNEVPLAIMREMRMTMFNTLLDEIEKIQQSKYSKETKRELIYKVTSKYLVEVRKLDDRIKRYEKELRKTGGK